MDVPIFFDNVSQKDWYKFGMAKNGHTKFFFQQFFPKRLVQIRNGQKWMFQFFFDNVSQKDWYKFGMAKNGHFKFFSNNFSQEDWYKFGMAKNGHSEFFPTIFPKKTGINLEWP